MRSDSGEISPETLAARIRQILKARELAVSSIISLLQRRDPATQEAALNIVLDESWRGELDLSERWILTQALEKLLKLFQHGHYTPSPELRARHRVLTWVRHTSAPTTLERTALEEIVDLDRAERDLTLKLFVQCIDSTHLTHRKPLRKIAADLHTQLNNLNDLEDGCLGETPEAEDAWLQLLIKHVTAQHHRWGLNSKAPPFLPQMADRLARRLLAHDFSAQPPHLTENIKMIGFSALSGNELSLETRIKLLQDALDDKFIPLTHYGSVGNASNLTITAKTLLELGQLPLSTLAAIRRSAAWAYSGDSLKDWLDILTPELNPGEAWSDAFLARLDNLSPEQRAPWPALVAFARTATAGKPSGKWLKEAQKHVGAVGAAKFREVLVASLPLLSRTRTFPLQDTSYYGGNPNLLLDNFNALSLKGLLWMTPLAADATLTRLLPGVVDSALKKVPGVGPREPKIANAAVYALSQIESEMALSALARLNTSVTFKGTLKEVQKALDVVAQRLRVTPDELLDMGVPTLGLQGVGERVDVLGEVEARLSVDATGAHLSFSKGGKALKSVPASVKKEFAEELKDLKAAQKEAEKVVSALAQRLDSLMIGPRVWRGETWAERSLNHPLAGTVARRLIWLLDGIPAFYSEGELRDLNGNTIPIRPESEVRLWHPIGRDVEEVLAWRNRLDALQVRQPFKQAWREVYVLTDAERRTGTYSNRFAGHILKQHQFNQLAALRGWRNKLRLMVDDSYPPAMRDLPSYGLRAEYWIEGIGENYGEDSTESGTYLRVTTDQVRFYPLGAPENHAHAGGGGYSMWVNQAQQPVNPLPMEEIPPLVLSEVLRDVDLFVGVASVGNDPTWQDGGPGGRFREYWQSYSFGELNETAKSRAEYLKRLIPRLKIRDRLELDGKFLKVRGERRTYKVHLGSSNILMEPNDQYLCIIPGGKGDGPDVDFDGDRVLSLVLSKAFLLADDTSITDPVILNQLKR